jgi:zinc/manganese transport system substrate-binding protein
VWGSIAAQVGGSRVRVRSLVDNPATDPHDYEPTPADARAVANARVVVVNGIGYDPWADRLLGGSHRAVVRVGDLVGLKPGDNPHQWYSPAAVDKVVAALADQFKAADPAHAADYDRQRTAFETEALAPYHGAITAIRSRFAGTPVAASESVVTPLADALGLKLLTPESFLDAISEGNEPTAADKATVDRLLRDRAVKLFVYNSQNATPDVRRLVDEAKGAGIAVVTVTETLTPKGATFQAWQTAQLTALQRALEGAR